MAESPPIVAIGLLTQHELELLGLGLDRVFPIDAENAFEDLVRAIDEADRRCRSGENADGCQGQPNILANKLLGP